MKRFIPILLAAMLLSGQARASDNFPMEVTTICSGPQTATTTSSYVTSTRTGFGRLMVMNNGTSLMYVTTGQGPVVATANNIPVAPGAVAVFTKKPNHDSLAALASSGTDSYIFCFGQGE